MRAFVFLVSLLSLIVSASSFANSQVKFEGTGNFSINGDQVSVYVPKISNQGNNRTGTLYLKLIANTQNSPTGNAVYVLAEGNLSTFKGSTEYGTLDPNQSFVNVRFTTEFRRPPAGTYYLFLHVSEYPNLNTSLDSMAATNNPFVFSSNTSGGGEGGGSGGSGDGGGSSSNFSLDCPCSYDLNNGLVTLKVSKVVNNQSNTTSGSLKLKLYATKQAYNGGSINGYVLAETNLGQLQPNTYFHSINRQPSFNQPPDGEYYLTLVLTEYNGQDYIVAYQKFSGTETFDSGNSGSGSGGGNGSGNASQNIDLECPCSYQIEGSRVNIEAAKVSHLRTSGSSGTLKLKLWATNSPYSGSGSINGYVIAEKQLDPLQANQYYHSIRFSEAYNTPPEGSYSVTLTVTEVQNGQEYLMDHVTFSNPLVVSNQQLSGSDDLGLDCPCSFEILGSTVELNVDKVSNYSDDYKNREIELKLWATSTPYNGGTIRGYTIAQVNLGSLNANQYWQDITRFTDYDEPPYGNYYFTMTLHEVGTDNTIKAYSNFSDVKTLGKKPVVDTSTGNNDDSSYYEEEESAGSLNMLWLILLGGFALRRRA